MFFISLLLWNSKCRTLLILMSWLIADTSCAFNCRLPRGCREQDVDLMTNGLGVQNWYSFIRGIRCDVNDKFVFMIPEGKRPPVLVPNDRGCHMNANLSLNAIIEIKWPANSNSILNTRFNLSNFFAYFDFFDSGFNFHLINLKGFEVNLFENRSSLSRSSPIALSLISSSFNFHHAERLVRSCDDLTNHLG